MRSLSTPTAALRLSCAVALALACAACQPAASTPAAGAAAPATPQGAPAAAGQAPGGKQYSVQAEALTLKTGEKKVATLRIAPADGLKFNAEFPTKFTVAPGPHARCERDKLTVAGGDIKIDGKVGVVSIPIVATAAGTGNLALQGRFSVCSDEQCFVLSDTLNVAVTVQ